MTEISELLEANKAYSESFDGGELEAPPSRGVVVLTCIDARIDPIQMLGLEIGEANIFRNAGGRVTDDAIRSATISSWLLGTREYVVIHHTDCGMTKFTDDVLHEKIREATGADVSGDEYLSFFDVDESVREDVARLRDAKTLPEGIKVTGLVYDVRTGELREVEPAA